MFAATKIALKVAILAATPLVTATSTSHETPAPQNAVTIQWQSQDAQTAMISGTLDIGKPSRAEKNVQSPSVTLTPSNSPATVIYRYSNGKSESFTLSQPNGQSQTFSAPAFPGGAPSSPLPNVDPKVRIYSSPGQPQLEQKSMTPSMTNIPKSYEIYLLHRSDGVLIGPEGVVPLKPGLPKATPVAPQLASPIAATPTEPKSPATAKP